MRPHAQTPAPVGPDAPTPAREEGLQPYGALYCFGWRSEGGAGGRAESPPACSIRQQLCRKQVPRWGMTRRLRRELGLAVPRGAHTFLSVAKEKCAKESQRHGDSGKKPFIAHFGGGARYVARSGVGQLRLLSCALGARLFPPSKWAGLFPSAAYRRSAPPQSAVGRLIPCGLGCFGVAWKFLHRKRPAGFQIHAGLFKRAMRPVAEWR